MALTGRKEQIQLDIDELKSLESTATRDTVKKLLAAEIINLEKKKELIEKAETAPKPASYSIPVTNFAWDQSAGFVKIYITLEKNHGITEDAVTLSFPTKRSVSTTFGKYIFQISKLNKEVDAEKSYFKVKTDSLLLMLKKGGDGGHWDDVREKEDKFGVKDKKDVAEDPSAGLMSLMKKMYDEGDDEMKRTINKSWYEAQSKKGGGMGTGDFGFDG